MRLTLSAAAAPGMPLGELLEACLRRGITSLELHEDGDEVSLDASPAEASAWQWRAAARGIRVSGIRAASGPRAASPGAALISARLERPVIAPAGSLTPQRLRSAAHLFHAAGGRLLAGVGTDRDAAAALRAAAEAAPGGVGLCWEVRPDRDDLDRAPAVLAAAGPLLRCILLYGGGPETAGQAGAGIGGLMAHLALARYHGPLVITPSSPARVPLWTRWLRADGGGEQALPAGPAERMLVGAGG